MQWTTIVRSIMGCVIFRFLYVVIHFLTINVTDCLKPGDLREVVRMVWDGRMKWYRIGLELLPDPAAVTVNVIRADHSRHPDVIECIHEMLQIWLDDGTPTWETLAAALRKPTVHLGRLAYNIERECLSAPDTESGRLQ